MGAKFDIVSPTFQFIYVLEGENGGGHTHMVDAHVLKFLFLYQQVGDTLLYGPDSPSINRIPYSHHAYNLQSSWRPLWYQLKMFRTLHGRMIQQLAQETAETFVLKVEITKCYFFSAACTASWPSPGWWGTPW